MHEILAHFFAGLLLELLGEIVGRGLANEGLAATGRAVEEEALGRGMLKARKEVRVQQRQFDGVANGSERFLLAADFFPRQLWHRIEVVFVVSAGRASTSIATLKLASTRTSSPALSFSFSRRSLRWRTVDCTPCSEPTRSRS